MKSMDETGAVRATIERMRQQFGIDPDAQPTAVALCTRPATVIAPTSEELAAARAATKPAGQQVQRFTTHLLKIAARVDPIAGEAAVRAWVAALLESLDEYPLHAIAAAMAQASKTQFRYLREVGPFLGEICDQQQRRATEHHRYLQLRSDAARQLTGPARRKS